MKLKLLFTYLILLVSYVSCKENFNSKLVSIERNIETINNHPPEYNPINKFDITLFTENTTTNIVDFINENIINFSQKYFYK